MHQRKTKEHSLINDEEENSFEGLKTGDLKKFKLDKVKWPLAFKIPLIGFVFSLVVSLIIAFTFYIESYQLVEKNEMRELSLEAEIIEPLFIEFYLQGFRDVSFLSATPPIAGIMSAKKINDEELFDVWQQRLNSIFIELLKTKPHYKRMSFITISSINNVVVSATKINNKVVGLPKNKLSKNIELISLKEILDAKDAQVFYSDVLMSNKEKNNEQAFKSNVSFFVAMPVLDSETNNVSGIVAIEVDLLSYIKELKSKSLKQVNFSVADQFGNFLYFSKTGFATEQTNTIKKSSSQIMKFIDRNAKSREIYNFNNNTNSDGLAFFSKINFDLIKQVPPLYLLIENHNDEFLIAIQNIRFRTIIISFSLAFISFFIAIFAARKLTTPLSRMTQSLSIYEKQGEIGDFPVEDKSEIGLLARSFHNLFATIEDNSSALKRIAVEAQSASLKLQATLNSIVDAVITINTNGEILAFNKSAREMFGYEEEEVINQSINMLMPAILAENHDEYIHNYLKSGDSNVFGVVRELSALRKDGEIFPMHLSISEVSTEDGIIYTGLIRDITESKLLDAEKKQILIDAKNSAWRLNFALSAPKIGVWDFDLETKHMLWDERMYQLFGVDSENSASPKSIWLEMIHPNDLDRVELLIKKALNSGEELNYQHRIVLSNDEIRYIEAHAQVMFDELGNKSRIVGTYRDNTEQRELQNLKQEALNMAEESLRLKSEFLASMSHEIRTPMNGVLGMLGLLEQSQLSKQQHHHVQLANSSAHSLLSLINDILDFSKIEAGKLDLEILDFDLRNQFGEFAESMAVRAQEKGLELVLDLTEVNYSIVRSDPSRLRQILSNLVGNSIKFTNSGEIVIKASLKELNGKLKLTCQISDTGIGIPVDKVHKLFDSFTQVDSTTTRKYGGTGLGLAIVKQLCELMEGQVRIESEINKGSCVTFSINLEKSENAQSVLPSVDIGTKEILIVDDNKTNLIVLKNQLEAWGASVTIAYDGYEALSILEKNIKQKQKFSIAIIDMQMPGMDGVTLGKIISENPHMSNIRLIMMTSMNEKGDANYFSNLGFSAYFPKPATTSDLFEALSTVLEKDNSELLNKANKAKTNHNLNQLQKRIREKKLPKNARILRVEDNRINQAVILGVLANIYLHADVAEDGLVALDMLNNCPSDNPYEIIIMDCQMPELDGYETSRIIRKGDVGEHFQDIPIIAMTANAMKGDKDKCIAAGMSDYATKPVDASILQEKLCYWLGERTYSVSNEKEIITTVSKDHLNHLSSNNDKANDEVWHQEAFLKRIRNNVTLADKLIKLFLEDSPGLMMLLQESIEQENHDDIVNYAHKLKGSVKNLGGNKLGLLCELVENNAKNSEKEKLHTHKTSLIKEFDLFIDELRRFIC
jgi:PAS domain S-box-containing protein